MSSFGQLSLPLRFANLVETLQEVCRWPLKEKAAIPAYGISFDWKHGIQARLLRNVRARRYLLRLDPRGVAQLTVPGRGNRAEAMRFLERQEIWLRKRHDDWRVRQEPWTAGKKILLRGEEFPLQIEANDRRKILRFGDQVVVTKADADFRGAAQRRLREIATVELAARTQELARRHGIEVRRVAVRAQRTRWGSCSTRGTISLNWRLIQAPVFVQDYLIIHELMHRREMNHSRRFWKHVETACPDYRHAERWLKQIHLEVL